MIPIKIITLDEAVKAGLTERKQYNRGGSAGGAGVLVKKNTDGTHTMMEKSKMKPNKDKDLVYMHKDRMKWLKEEAKDFDNYIKQFKTIKGKDREEFIKEKNIKKVDQEIK